MTAEPALWGLHMGKHVSTRPIDEGYVAIGWPRMGDLHQYADREAFKTALAIKYPEKKPGAIPIDAGTLYRFSRKIREGDLIVYPSKHDRMVNIGRITGPYHYVPDDPDDYPNQRKVEWLTQLPRSDFNQATLSEIGSFITLFTIRTGRTEFLSKIGMQQQTSPPLIADAADEAEDEVLDDDSVVLNLAQRASEATTDFIIQRIKEQLDGYEFEALVAHLLECMGYIARLTPASGDGGVDIIAHRDKLGLEPPILKVQCKSTTGQIPRPDADQLLGTLGEGEYGLLVTLGSFSKPSLDLERNRPKLRLINGEEFIKLLLEHYSELAPRYRSFMPLRQIYVPDPQI